MSWVDVVIVVWVALAAVRGRTLGALSQLCGLLGFVFGLAVGSVIAVPISGRLQAGLVRSAVTVCMVLGLAVMAGIGGTVLGKWANVAMRRRKLGSVDAAGGAAVAAISALLSAWLVAGLFAQSATSWLTSPIQRSGVLAALDAVLPPVPSVVARAQAFLSNEGFPAAFAALTQPTTSGVAVPPHREARAIADGVTGAVVRVVASGGCGVTRQGTGFVAGTDLVVTAAHVVAGQAVVVVVADTGGYSTQVALFDPELDVAVLRVTRLDLPSVTLSADVAERGTPAAIVGYPGGGPRRVMPAGVAEALDAEGRDIYGGGLVARSIYAVSATVLPGSSGSPLVVGGEVAGMVFSRSLTQSDLAYALRSTALRPDLEAAASASAPVPTGACTPG